MKDFKQGGGFNRGGDRGGNRFGGDRGGDRGGRGGFGGGNRFGGDRGGDRGGRGGFGDRPTMHKTTCSECGKMAEVPFKPNGDKPVLCSDCFGGARGNDRPRTNDRGDRRGGDRDRNFGNKDRAPQGGGVDVSKLKDDVASLHKKMDAIMTLLGGTVEHSPKEEVKEAPTKTPKREKPAAGELTNAIKKAVKTDKKETKTVKKVVKKVAKKKK